jgi:hypothetical protein
MGWFPSSVAAIARPCAFASARAGPRAAYLYRYSGRRIGESWVSLSSSSGLSLANSLTRSCGKKRATHCSVNRPKLPQLVHSGGRTYVVYLNIECRDRFFDSLLARVATIYRPCTHLIFAGNTASYDKVALTNIPFYFDLYASFVAPMTDEEVDVCSTSQ